MLRATEVDAGEGESIQWVVAGGGELENMFAIIFCWTSNRVLTILF
jgi:hypothetical protein